MYTLFQSYFLQCLPTHICFLIILCLYKLSLYYLLLIWVHNISFLLPSSSLQSMFTNSHLIFSFHIFSDWVLLLLIVCPHHLSLASLAFSAKSTTHASSHSECLCSVLLHLLLCIRNIPGLLPSPLRQNPPPGPASSDHCIQNASVLFSFISYYVSVTFQFCFPYLFGKIYHLGWHLLITSFIYDRLFSAISTASHLISSSIMPMTGSPLSLIMCPYHSNICQPTPNHSSSCLTA